MSKFNSLLFLLISAYCCLANPILQEDVTYSSEILATSKKYRLPGDTVPISYEILLEPDIPDTGKEEEFTFEGESKIRFKAVKETKIIKLHALDLAINKEHTRIMDTVKNSSVTVLSESDDRDLHFHLIEIKDKLVPNKEYILSMKYKGILNNQLKGFYRSSYTQDGKTKWLATTHFEPVGARQAFPCWDEPALKATFKISIKHPKSFKTVVSNMPVEKEDEDKASGKIITHFKTTQKMSSYLVAFVVADYEKVGTSDGKHTVYTRRDKKNATDYALQTAQTALAELDKYTKIPYNEYFPKLDQISIPDFSAGAMENWGLVTYRESALLHLENVTTTNSKQGIGTVIAHEYAHQWFGNLVSPLWWKYLWLNEGFATFFQTYITNIVEPEWDLLNQFVIKTQQATAFVADAEESTQPMNRDVNSPAEISGMFDSISYSKAGSVIRMMMHIVSEPVFQAGLQSYLNEKKLDVATSDDLFKSLQKEVDKKEKEIKLPATVKEIMDTWVTQKGYPVVTVARDYNKETAQIKQERYFSEEPSKTDNNKWWIPINYAVQKDANFNETKPTHWVKNNNEELQLEKLKKDEWIILNKQQTGFYRVNYDKENWQLITKTLDSDNYTEIHVTNRAQLINDALNLARVGKLDYVEALNLVSYLARESDYIAWYPFFAELNFFNRLLVVSEQYETFKAFIATRMSKIINEIKYKENYQDEHTKKLLRIEALKWSCVVGLKECNTEAEQVLNNWLKDSVQNPLNANLRSNLLCAGLRVADKNTWDMVLTRYNSSTDNEEKSAILTSLGCSSSKETLENYLKMAIEDNSIIKSPSSVLSAVYAGSSQGMDIALDFIIDNYEKIRTIKNIPIKTHVTELGKRITTKLQYGKFTLFVERQKMENDVKSMGLKFARRNLDWIDTYEPIITKWLKEKGFTFPAEDKKSKDKDNSANSFAAITSLLIIPFLITRWL